MNKIASPQELQTELRRLLAYAQSEKPSREKLASELRGLAERVASNDWHGRDAARLDPSDGRKIRTDLKRMFPKNDIRVKLLSGGTQDGTTRIDWSGTLGEENYKALLDYLDKNGYATDFLGPPSYYLDKAKDKWGGDIIIIKRD